MDSISTRLKTSKIFSVNGYGYFNNSRILLEGPGVFDSRLKKKGMKLWYWVCFWILLYKRKITNLLAHFQPGNEQQLHSCALDCSQRMVLSTRRHPS